MGRRIINVPKGSGAEIETPTEILAGGFEYKHPYTDGNSYFDSTQDNIQRLIAFVAAAKTPQEIETANLLKEQFFERQRQNLLLIIEGINKRIEDSVKNQA